MAAFLRCSCTESRLCTRLQATQDCHDQGHQPSQSKLNSIRSEETLCRATLQKRASLFAASSLAWNRWGGKAACATEFSDGFEPRDRSRPDHPDEYCAITCGDETVITTPIRPQVVQQQQEQVKGAIQPMPSASESGTPVSSTLVLASNDPSPSLSRLGKLHSRTRKW